MEGDFKLIWDCIDQIDRLVKDSPARSFVVVRETDRMIWRGNVRPTVMSETYLVEIDYRISEHPDVRVLCPELVRYQDQSLPHVYPGDLLCLYFPGAKHPEWTPAMWLSETILPWSALWLEFYEHWVVTGQWFGGGVHPKESSLS